MQYQSFTEAVKMTIMPGVITLEKVAVSKFLEAVKMTIMPGVNNVGQRYVHQCFTEEVKMTIILDVNNVTKIYQKGGTFSKTPFYAVKGLSFSVNEGEVVGFLGANGSGKSTTIKMITGLASITSGKITVVGCDVTKDSIAAKRYISGIIENPDMFLDKTGFQNLMYFASLSEKPEPKNVLKNKVEEMLNLVGLISRKDDIVSKYSLGMKQRLGIANALLSKPKLLILDEPANGLDPQGIKELRELLRFIAENEKTSVLVSSHQLSEMQLLCDRVVIIKDGQKIAERNVSELNISADGSVAVIIKCKEPNTAKTLLAENLAINCEVFEEQIKFKSDKDVAEITRILVMNGVDVFGVESEKRSLEDIFFEITKG